MFLLVGTNSGLEKGVFLLDHWCRYLLVSHVSVTVESW